MFLDAPRSRYQQCCIVVLYVDVNSNHTNIDVHEPPYVSTADVLGTVSPISRLAGCVWGPRLPMRPRPPICDDTTNWCSHTHICLVVQINVYGELSFHSNSSSARHFKHCSVQAQQQCTTDHPLRATPGFFKDDCLPAMARKQQPGRDFSGLL